MRDKLRVKIMAENRPCWICRAFGKTGRINYSLRFPHPYSFVLDELVPVSKYWMGGYQSAEAAALDYNNLAAAHKVCNEWRGNKTVDEVMAIARGERKRARKPPSQHNTSRDWSRPRGGDSYA
jgi:hypothetical protein